MGHQIPRWLVVGCSALLFGAILGLRIAEGDAADATLVLFVIPIAISAIEFGMRGGVTAAMLALGLLVGFEVIAEGGIAVLGVATRAVAYLTVGGLLGRFVDSRRALEARVDRHYDLSLDLFGTASFDGYFEELNPAWEQTLGYTTTELCSRPFIEFVHPDDRERTAAEAAKLADGIETVSFRNRYLTAEGKHKWLEWNARSVPEERRLYATARDITPQYRAEQALRNQSEWLERMVAERTQDLEASRLETLQRLAIAAEYRDGETHQHTERVGRTAALIAEQLGLSDETVALIRRAAPLHDIGKVGIPDAILRKPGKLAPLEWDLMKQHVEIGARILGDGSFDVLLKAHEIVLSHHERWDGTGYPNGGAGEAIPLAGRIVAVADAFDAMTHARPYKPAWSIPDVLVEIRQASGSQFDARVVEAFATLDHGRLLEDVMHVPDLGPPLLIGDA